MKPVIFCLVWLFLFGLCCLAAQPRLGHQDSHFRIIDGRPAELGEFPFTAEINDYCTGTLIHPQWVLTAAHCLLLAPILSTIRVRVGHITTKTGGQARRVSKIIVHPGYTNFVFADHTADLGLIKLSSPVDTGSPQVDIAELPEGSLEDNSIVTIPGWGVIEKVINGTDVPTQVLNVAVYKTTTCPPTRQTHLCTAPVSGRACNGDSGSFVGVRSNQRLDRWVVHGVVSEGDKFCGNGTLVFHTDVFAYKQWILDTINYE